ncbi:sulfatase-like hydrolase/transferase [Roseicyclus persicicus]|uniref:Sulfatase-like hydrolase/transferase n=1 Tax=Roseicyclus persicicus TaxID=2650661 RepID=A0A7X6GZJ9_9RHOB|nr:sulfatase-like hydrolase/transferase [Roseibacterium persicicum]NKX45275.1 sulfatase-like hydrolase/transferase [Roseibacterium persicicum]
MSDGKNVLLVSFDDCIAFMNYRSAFGAVLQTPNLDRIMACSSVFRSAYCQVPLCGPSRASFMTGRMPHQLGVLSNADDVFERIDPREIWTYRLKEGGYFCSSGGKVHHGYKPLKRRIHNVLYSDAQKRFTDDMSLPPGVERKRYHGIRGGWGTTDEKDDALYYDAQSSSSAIEFLTGYDGAAPFYRELGFFSPHGPRFTPARFKEMYDLDAFQPPESWAGGFDETDYTRETMPFTPWLETGDMTEWRYNVRNYFAALSHGDHHLGLVWDALQETGHARNTIVVILSDHGFLLGARQRFYKTTLWEQSVGTPLVIHDPEAPVGRVIDQPVGLIDVGPTVLDLLGLPPMEDSVGRSLRSLIAGGTRPERPVASYRFGNATIRSGPYRIIRYEDGSTQLFDLRTDPWTLKDLGRDHPAHAGLLAELQGEAAAHGLSFPIDA